MSISIEEYRRIMSDKLSTDEQILKKLSYLEDLCRNVIRHELEEFEKSSRKQS